MMKQTATLIPLASQVPAPSPEVLRYRAASRSDSTKKIIAKCWRAFQAWCEAEGLKPFPCQPETLEAYLIHLVSRGLKAATIEQHRYAINIRHRLSGLSCPGNSHLVKTVMAGIRRTIGTHQRKAAPLTIKHVRSLTFPNDLKGRRDRALLMVAVCSGLRASELVGLRLEHLERTENGYRLFLPRSKGDQEGEGAYVSLVKTQMPLERTVGYRDRSQAERVPPSSSRSGISPISESVEESVGVIFHPPTRQAERVSAKPSYRADSTSYCPVAALDAWILEAGLSVGPVFLGFKRYGALMRQAITTQTIDRIVKEAAGRLGLDPSLYSAHSTRAGCATYLLEHGVALNVVAKHLRHRHADTTLCYDRSNTAQVLEGVY